MPLEGVLTEYTEPLEGPVPAPVHNATVRVLAVFAVTTPASPEPPPDVMVTVKPTHWFNVHVAAAFTSVVLLPPVAVPVVLNWYSSILLLPVSATQRLPKE